MLSTKYCLHKLHAANVLGINNLELSDMHWNQISKWHKTSGKTKECAYKNVYFPSVCGKKWRLSMLSHLLSGKHWTNLRQTQRIKFKLKNNTQNHHQVATTSTSCGQHSINKTLKTGEKNLNKIWKIIRSLYIWSK